MNIGWIIALALLGFGVSLKKQIVESKRDAESCPQGPAPAVESLFEEEQDEPLPQSFEDEEREAGYFSYETINAMKESRPFEEVFTPSVPETEPHEAPLFGDFDLRQAIIYQTILHNEYLPNYNYNRN